MKSIRSLLLGAALVAAFSCQALAQVADQDHVWATPGNSAVGGGVPMCPRASDGKAVPCAFPASAPGTNAAGYPAGAAIVVASATGTTGAVTATLPAAAGKFTYLCGLSVSPGSATAAITLQVTTGGLGGAGKDFTWAVGAPVTAAGTTGQPFTPPLGPACIPGSAVNTAVTVTSSALGAGGINNDVNVWGFQY